MKLIRSDFRSRVGAVLALALATFLLGMPRPASAQLQGPIASLSDEQRSGTWKKQSDLIAAELGLSAENAAKLADAYSKARASQIRATSAAAKAHEGDMPAIMKAVSEAHKKDRKAFNDAIKGFVDEKQLDRINKTLGAFEGMWDVYLSALSELKLSDEERTRANSVLVDYVVKAAPTRSKAYAQGDGGLLHQNLRSSREELNQAMEKALSPKSFEAWSQTTARKRQGSGKK